MHAPVQHQRLSQKYIMTKTQDTSSRSVVLFVVVMIESYHIISPSPSVMSLTLCSFALGHLYSNTRKTVGILDLGGGSTQITFLPKSKVN